MFVDPARHSYAGPSHRTHPLNRARHGRTLLLAGAVAVAVSSVAVSSAAVSSAAVSSVAVSASADPAPTDQSNTDQSNTGQSNTGQSNTDRADAGAGADGRIFFGVVGDQSQVQGSPATLGHHNYGQLVGPVPLGRMITMGTSGRSYAAIASAEPGSATYADIARWADTVQARGTTILFGFGHEPEASKQARLGGPGPYIAAYRHVVDVFRARGVDNVEYVWQMTDFSFSLPDSDPRQAAKWYPGDAYVDGVGSDAYNWYDCGPGHGKWRELSIPAAPALAFARDHGKKLVLPEFGSQTGPLRAQWLDDAHQWMVANQDSIMAAFYFDRPATTAGNGCVFPLSSDVDVSALSGIAQDTAHFVG